MKSTGRRTILIVALLVLATAPAAAKDRDLELNKLAVSSKRLKRNAENTAKLYGMLLTRPKSGIAES